MLLPRLEVLDRSALPVFMTPVKRIHETGDVAEFLVSQAYRDVGTFIMQLNHAVCPRIRRDSSVPLTFTISSPSGGGGGDGEPTTTTTTTAGSRSSSAPVTALQDLLSAIARLIDDAPPAPGPRRFGNLSFRKWHTLLEDRAGSMLTRVDVLGHILSSSSSGGGGDALGEVKSYLLGSFGSAQRLDYGTGHELSFLAFLGCLWKLGHFCGTDKPVVEMEREIVFAVIEPYLALVRKLITTYTLEPAGSHGVWGLDDHFFIPYIFGSAQLTRPIHDEGDGGGDGDPMPLEGSVRGAPKPGDVVKAPVVEDNRHTNMYFSAIGFINDIKRGPFWEHSPMLFDISGVRDGWGKINKGMIKMYNAEVLSKFPVVQHFPFGSLFSWNKDAQAQTPAAQPVAVPTSLASSAPSVKGTEAPWAQASRRIPTAVLGVPGRMAPIPAQRPAPSTEVHGGGDMPTTKAPWAK